MAGRRARPPRARHAGAQRQAAPGRHPALPRHRPHEQPESFGRAGTDTLLADLTGTTAPNGWGRHAGPQLAANASDALLPLVLLAQHAADIEGEMGVHTWRHHSDRHAAWLTYLATTGYTLSDIEQTVIDNTAPATDPDPDTGEGEPTNVVVVLDCGTDDPVQQGDEPAA